MIRTNIRIYSYQKNNTNEYLNIFASKKWYEYDTNEYSYRKIFEYIRISEYSPHPEMNQHEALNTEILKYTMIVQPTLAEGPCHFLRLGSFMAMAQQTGSRIAIKKSSFKTGQVLPYASTRPTGSVLPRYPLDWTLGHRRRLLIEERCISPPLRQIHHLLQLQL